MKKGPRTRVIRGRNRFWCLKPGLIPVPGLIPRPDRSGGSAHRPPVPSSPAEVTPAGLPKPDPGCVFSTTLGLAYPGVLDHPDAHWHSLRRVRVPFDRTYAHHPLTPGFSLRISR